MGDFDYRHLHHLNPLLAGFSPSGAGGIKVRAARTPEI
jgi:hypothetical protein